MKYSFRKYTDDDYEFIYNLKKQAYKEYVEKFWGNWDDQQQHKFFDNYIAKQKDRILIIVVDKKDVGYFDDNIENDIYEIVNICIMPEYQGNGIGTDILKKQLEKNKDKEIHIQHFISNPVGKLYSRLGFVESEKTATHVKMKYEEKENI